MQVKVFNHGRMSRDFTCIDDIVEGVVRIFKKPPDGNKGHALYNIGNSSRVPLMEFMEAIERCCGRTAKRILLPMQDGDVPTTFADTSRLEKTLDLYRARPCRKACPVLSNGFVNTTRFEFSSRELALKLPLRG